MKGHFAYIRVSTTKQSEHGSSLQEQRAAIEGFCARNDITIAEWFEETETAAKQGRRAFNRMIADIERGRAAGLVVHKIDRSARNLKDWARLGELLDRGVDVQFVQDNLDLSTRGGRLAADLQAVVAADYIRNLRDEVRKGIYGRLKQGIYPFGAPRGYLNRGKGKLKDVDPVLGPLVRQAFELYGSGTVGLHQLRTEMAARGLRGSSGRPLSLAAISNMLHCPFYMGVLRLPSTGEVFEGKHQPLVSGRLFARVQDILSGRLYARVEIHRFLFRRLIKCGRCGRSLTGERQKGIVYYRCHDYGCTGVSVRETAIDQFVRAELGRLRVDERDVREFRDVIRGEIEAEDADAGNRVAAIDRELTLAQGRLDRLTDAYLDGSLDKETYEGRKESLVAQRLDLREQRERPPDSTFWRSMAERFELGFAAQRSYEMGNADEKRETLQIVSSNLIVHGKKPVFPMLSPFNGLREWSDLPECAHSRGAVRTFLRQIVSEQSGVAIGSLNSVAQHDTKR